MTYSIKKNAPDDTFRVMQEALNHGCSDGGCVIERTKGQHTNGGCKCLYHPDFMTLRRVGHMLLAAQDMADEITRLRADLAAAREQVAGALLAAEQIAIGYHTKAAEWAERMGFRQQALEETDSSLIAKEVHALTPADATAALEARDARVRAEAEQKWRDICQWAYDRLEEINASNYDHDDVCRLNDASVEVILGLSAALHTADSRKAGGE